VIGGSGLRSAISMSIFLTPLRRVNRPRTVWISVRSKSFWRSALSHT
jgi:hypothetical protein